jgi:hypothetical protein
VTANVTNNSKYNSAQTRLKMPNNYKTITVNSVLLYLFVSTNSKGHACERSRSFLLSLDLFTFVQLSLSNQSLELFVVFVLCAMLNCHTIVRVIKVDSQVEFQFFRNRKLMRDLIIQ